MTSLKTKRLSLSEKFKAIIEVESGKRASKVAEELTAPLVTIAKTAVKNLLKDLIFTDGNISSL